MVFSIVSYNVMFFTVDVICYLFCCLRVVIFFMVENVIYLLISSID